MKYYLITWWTFYSECWGNGLLKCVPFTYQKITFGYRYTLKQLSSGTWILSNPFFFSSVWDPGGWPAPRPGWVAPGPALCQVPQAPDHVHRHRHERQLGVHHQVLPRPCAPCRAPWGRESEKPWSKCTLNRSWQDFKVSHSSRACHGMEILVVLS